METHSAWYLIPSADAEGVDWKVFPEDIEFALPDDKGFRGFIVEFYNIISGMCVCARAHRKYIGCMYFFFIIMDRITVH